MAALDVLPAPRDRRLAVRISRRAEQELRRGHPWLFEAAITSITEGGQAGDLAVVFDAHRQFLAIGLFDPTSVIRVRVLAHRTPTTIDRVWWRTTIDTALARRAPLMGTGRSGTETTGFRAINGENDGLGGLIVDRYGPVLVLKLYTPAWFRHLATVVPELVAALAAVGVEVSSVVVRLARSVARGETHGLVDGSTWPGGEAAPVVEPVEFLENGLRFGAYPVTGQKTGFFLDQRDNRQRVRERAAGARVLDVFCCTGGFSVAAAAGGARRIHAIDRAPQAVAVARENLERNRDRIGPIDARFETADAFAALERLGAERARFDLVVVDPPAFATKAADRPAALAAYRRLAELALPLVAPGGTLVQASCSSRITADELLGVVNAAAARLGINLAAVEVTGHAIDHPVGFDEGHYLKAIFAQVS